MRLMFETVAAAPTAGTRGTTIDHIGFEVKNLAEFMKKLEARASSSMSRIARFPTSV